MIELKPRIEVRTFYPRCASGELSVDYILISVQYWIDTVANPDDSNKQYLLLAKTFQLEVDHLRYAYRTIPVEVKIGKLILELD